MKKQLNKGAKSAKKVQKANKVRKPSPVQVAKSEANNKYKEFTASLSGMNRYIKGEGRTDVISLIKVVNERYGSKLKIEQINQQFILRHMSEGRKLNEDGTKRTKFSFYLDVLNTITKVARG